MPKNPVTPKKAKFIEFYENTPLTPGSPTSMLLQAEPPRMAPLLKCRGTSGATRSAQTPLLTATKVQR